MSRASAYLWCAIGPLSALLSSSPSLQSASAESDDASPPLADVAQTLAPESTDAAAAVQASAPPPNEEEVLPEIEVVRVHCR